jgi:hypothetical protein
MAFCNNCGTKLPEGAKFCHSCGAAAAPAQLLPKFERKIPNGVPDFVKNAVIHAADDVLIGIGSAKLESLAMSITIAETRARVSICRQTGSLFQDMARDYYAGTEVDPLTALTFQEHVTISLSKSTLPGIAVVSKDKDAEGTVWAVVQFDKKNLLSEITTAVSSAKKTVPAMISFHTNGFDAAFLHSLKNELVVENEG